MLLQFDGQGRTLNNTGDIINNRVITGTTGTRGRTAILMGSATLNAGSGTLFTTTTTPTTGATTVKLNAAPTTAYVGQTMVFGRYNAGEGDFSLGEQRVITAVNIAAKTVTFATPLTGSYAGSGTDPIGYKVVSNYGAGSTVDGVFYNNVIINSGTVSSQISAAEINGDKTSSSPTITSVSNTAAVKAITASVEGSYLINNTASGIISVKHDGTGNALAIEEGGAVTSMTINNAGLISAERTSHLVLADNFAVTATSPALTTSATSTDYVGFTKQTIGNVNAINTQEEADVLIVNNTSTGVIRSNGDFTGTIYMRAADKTIINDGLIEHVSSAGGADYSKGFAIAAVSDAGEVRDLSLTNNGNIHGDISGQR